MWDLESRQKVMKQSAATYLLFLSVSLRHPPHFF